MKHLERTITLKIISGVIFLIMSVFGFQAVGGLTGDYSWDGCEV